MKLLENGKDSLKKAIEKLNNTHRESDGLEYEFKLKDIVINLHHSIETMFKYMIKEKDEFLLYSNCDNIFNSRVLSKFNNNKNEEIKTIQFIEAINRVIVLYNIDIRKEDYNNFKILNEIRNSLTHYERDFSDNEIEHLISLILPILLRIYKDNIDGFDNWANENNIYSNVNSMTKEIEIWSINQYYSWKEKYQNALDEITRLEQEPSEKEEKYSLRKNKDITYLECKICRNKFFHPTGNYILSADEILYLGKCKYCAININNIDAQFISLYYGNYSEDLNGVSEYLGRIMIDYLLSLEHNSDELTDRVIRTLEENRNVFKELKHRLGLFIGDIVTRVAEEYFEGRICSDKESIKEISEYENCEISKDIGEFLNYNDINSELLGEISLISSLIDKVNVISNDLGKEIEKYINEDYISYHSGIYLDYNGGEIESEITFSISFDIDEVREKLA